MALKLFNTLTRSVREFVPLDPAGRAVGHVLLRADGV